MVTYAGDEKGAGKKMIRKLKEVGFRNVLVGGVKKVRYMQMINKYHFDPWHLSPYEWKEYAQACVRYLNTRNCKTVVDIGCGLGEVLRYIKARSALCLIHPGTVSNRLTRIVLPPMRQSRNG